MTIFLDYNATTPLAPEVIEIISTALTDAWGNASSSYEAGQIAKQYIHEARESVATCIGAKSADIIFTSGGSESNNWVINSVVEKCFIKNRGLPHVVTSTVEHDSILAPLQVLESQGRIALTKVGISKSEGVVDLAALEAAINQNTCLVTVMMANNETGVIMPIEHISKIVRKCESSFNTRILFHTDAAQTIGKIPVDVSALDVDFLTIVGHKFYGPRIGALYIRDLVNSSGYFGAFIHGGGQERGWRSGTENTPMVAGLGKACQLISHNLAKYTKNMQETRDFLRKRLEEVFGAQNIRFNGSKAASTLPNTTNVSLLFPNCSGLAVVKHARKFSCSVGAACHSHCGGEPSKILLQFHTEWDVALNALRISTGRDTSLDDIEVVVTELREIVDMLKKSEA